MDKAVQMWTPCTVFLLMQRSSLGVIIAIKNKNIWLNLFHFNLVLTRASDSIGSENMEVSFSLPWRSKRIWKFWMLTNQQGVWNVWGKFMWLRNVIERDYVHPLPWKDVSFIHIFQASCLYSYYFHREGFYHFFKVTIQK